MPGCVWTNEAVTLLLSLYLREQQLARPQKLKKKDVWRGICTELWRRGLVCSWQECDKKYRNLKQTFVRNLKQAGKKECRWMFFPLMLEINRHEPFVGDVLVSSATGTGSNNHGNSEDATYAVLDAYANNNNNNNNAMDDTDADGPDEGMDNSVSYTPSTSPGVMNLSQRHDRTPDSAISLLLAPPAPMSLAVLHELGVSKAKRRRADAVGYKASDTLNAFDSVTDYQNNDNNNTVIVKIESPPLPQTPTHHTKYPALNTSPIIKRSVSPKIHAQPAQRVAPELSAGNRSLVPLDIRLLQAAIPFVTHGVGFGSHSLEQHQVNHQQQQLSSHHQTEPLAVMVKSTALNSPSTMISSEEDNNEDDDDDDDNADDINGNIRNNTNGTKAALHPLLNANGADIGDEETTRSMPDADEQQPNPHKQPQATPQPPKWFNVFMAEFRRHEHRKLQQIAELCAEVRRTNDIEQQRNHILSEKNEILRHMNTYMLNK